ncbi:3-oxo-tetronate kinase [Marinobacter sp. JSM 1782161]|uniref:3-oxo-tetronate kinase n=1 Tax=Marinobacter sp. JSM 1782161 TaxID=2685906 RepID=UPI001403B291|nr:3-oxo-tetronate kinase [Marinobacter sp. JSM 1782161]
MSVLLGCIADDLTGATDLAGFLRDAGMRPLLLTGLPQEPPAVDDADAVIIALKSRTQAPPRAVASSLAALECLQGIGCGQYYFKYGSTFDSTDQGNIGPVLDALLDRLGEDITVACPALPVNGRTQYLGHLFVNGRPLNESGMEQHPLNPMTDACLVRVLDRQTRGRVGLVDHHRVEQGAGAIAETLSYLRRDGVRYALVDTLCQKDLATIGAACADLRLVTGGSGLAGGLAAYFRSRGWLEQGSASTNGPPVAGAGVILSGSCSRRTREQVRAYRQSSPSLHITPERIASGEQTAAMVIDWFHAHCTDDVTPMVYASAEPEQVTRSQQALGTERAGELLESLLGEVAAGLSSRGVRKFIVAGGETSGAVIRALGVQSLRIDDSIAPGVPATRTLEPDCRVLVLKSGNFGDPDFFREAIRRLQ